MNANRYQKPLFAIAIVAMLVLMATAQLPWRSHIAQALQDTTHIAVAAAIAYLFCCLIRTPINTGKLVAFFLAFAATALAETLQWGLGRPFEWTDLLLNAAGAAVVLLWIPPKSSIRRAVAALILVAAVSPLLLWASAYSSRNRAFPVLFQCGASWSMKFASTDHAELRFLANSISENTRGSGDDLSDACLLKLSPAVYPGISIDEPVPNWSGYKFLVLTFFNQSNGLIPLTVRIHDRQHNQAYDDRYNYSFSLEHGLTTIRIDLDDVKAAPAKRNLDMREIAGVILFAINPKSELVFRMGNPTLETQTDEAALR